MKKIIFTLFLVVTATGLSVQAHVQEGDYLGLPGDNLNLFAVLKLFQESQTLESFERDLNDENNHINNLDLDNDGRIDYIRVVDHVDGDYHTIVMQDALGPHEVQDVAVFTVYRDRNGRVNIQLTGDEALYGRDYIIEPNYSDVSYGETPNPGYSDYRDVNGERVYVTRTTTYEVAYWPVIRFIYMPSYTVWVSPWYYNYYPSYWHPWRPYYWHYYYGYHYNWDNYYYSHYRVWHHHHDNYWQENYYSRRRAYSPSVYNHVKSGTYERTYSHPESRHDGYNRYYKDHPTQQPRRSAATISDPVAERGNVGSAQRGATYDRRTSGNPQTRSSSGSSSSGSGNRSTYNSGSSSGSGSGSGSGSQSTGSGRRSTETRSTSTSGQHNQPAGNTQSTQTQTRTTQPSDTHMRSSQSGNSQTKSTQSGNTQTRRSQSGNTQTRSTQNSTGNTSQGHREATSGGSRSTTTTKSSSTQQSTQSSGSNRSAGEQKTETHPASEQKKSSSTSGGNGSRR